jgi:xylan 1,4-beta-xylosidase
VPGDHPDPTIVQVDGVFWASATSGEWSPQFPLYCSTDLIRWSPAGSIFPVQPGWAEGSFWAPELVHDEVSGCVVAWYVAKRRNGPLCIACATAPAPAGPYTDRGPLICQEDGSIDPCFARDENGDPFLIWKEDGNSRGQPTPIWAQPLTSDLLHLTGDKTQLIVNDQPWEEGIVEGPYILRRDGMFYMFYAGNACCGRECKYAEGVARAERLLGPWEKNPGNPIVGPNETWRCPGHGTAVQTKDKAGKSGQAYLLYHAYPANATIYVGREAILDEITWPEPGPDGKPGWPAINAGRGPGQLTPAAVIDFTDDFEASALGPSWQWPVNTYPEVHSGQRSLTLGIPMKSPLAAGPVQSAMVAVPRPSSLHYEASVAIDMESRLSPDLWAGLSIVGDPFNTIGLGLRGDPKGTGHLLWLWERRGSYQAIVWETEAPQGTLLYLRANSVGAEHHVQFSFSGDGKRWREAGTPYDATGLPAWDRGLRIGLMLEGPEGRSATFRKFTLRAQP